MRSCNVLQKESAGAKGKLYPLDCYATKNTGLKVRTAITKKRHDLIDALFSIEMPKGTSAETRRAKDNQSSCVSIEPTFCNYNSQCPPLDLIQFLVGEIGAVEGVANTGKIYSEIVCPCIAVVERARGHEGSRFVALRFQDHVLSGLVAGGCFVVTECFVGGVS